MEVVEYSSEKFIKELSQASAQTSLAIWVPPQTSDSARVRRTAAEGGGSKSRIDNLCSQKMGGEHPRGLEREVEGRVPGQRDAWICPSELARCSPSLLPSHWHQPVLEHPKKMLENCAKTGVCFCPLHSLDLWSYLCMGTLLRKVRISAFA